MIISARLAVEADVPRLVSLYQDMEAEQIVRKPIWALTDGVDEPHDALLLRAMDTPDSFVLVGEIDDAAVGLLWATVESMLDRAKGLLIGRMRLIYTEPDARGVGVGHTMLTTAMDRLRDRDIRHFDAPVGPGQRAAKNFFESHAFAARSIIMHSTGPGDDDQR